MHYDQVLIYIIRGFITLIHLLSYAFNAVLLYLIIRKKVFKTKVYMWNMVVAEIILNICQHVVIESTWIVDEGRSMIVQVFSFIYLTATQLRFLLTFLMSINRFVVVLSPEKNVYFDQEMLRYYSYCLWILTTTTNAIYFLNDCYFNLKPITYQWSIDCYHWKVSHYLEKAYYVLIITCAFNVMVVIVARCRRLLSVGSVSAPRVSPTSAETRRANENAFIVQAVIIMMIMAIDGAYNGMRQNYVSQFPIVAEYLIGSVIVYSSSLINFLIYFAFHRLAREHVLNFVLRKPKYVPNPKLFINSIST